MTRQERQRILQELNTDLIEAQAFIDYYERHPEEETDDNGYWAMVEAVRIQESIAYWRNVQ